MPEMRRDDHFDYHLLIQRIRTVARFTLPYAARVLVASQGDAGFLALDGLRAQHFPQDQGGNYGHHPADDAEAIARLEALRAAGAQFILFPSNAFWWLEHYSGLKTHLDRHYRVVLQRADTCVIYALHDPRIGPDGLPLPEPEMRALVTSVYEPETFLRLGEVGAGCIRDILARNGLSFEQFRSVLDFGCGCGRIARNWAGVKGPRLYGTDYNPYLIEWCRWALPFGEFDTNQLTPPLAYDPGQFDFIYTISIFTHLDESLQHAWMAELRRVLAPGGYLLFTVHGATRLPAAPSEIRRRFEAGEFVVTRPEFAGSNACTTWHPESYVRGAFARDFEIVDYIPDGSKDAQQDAYLVRKPIEQRLGLPPDSIGRSYVVSAGSGVVEPTPGGQP